jgi:hypothetical protein
MKDNLENLPGSAVSRRTMLVVASAGIGGGALARPAEVTRSAGHTRNVRDFGAKGDGITDDTEAFNRATEADVEWSWDLLCSIIVPAGRYRIAGTVFLRKGQSLIGEGLSTYIDAAGAKRSTFIMGRRRDNNRGVEDPGGLPVRVERLMGLGGAPDQGFIYAAIPGFQISALFLTAVGLGIEIEAADGIISDVEIDQCLTGILIRNSQNVVLSNLNLYLANYGITFAGNCRDIGIVNSILCYSKFAAILLGDGVENITSISVTGCIFTNNVPYETFEGYIYSRASNSDLLVTGCIFRNSPGYAVNQGAGVELSMSLHGCLFDGERTNPDYNQSLTPKGIRTGHGRFSLFNCTFRRLASEAIHIGAGLLSLDVEGGVVEEIARDVIIVDGDPAGPVAIRNMRGLAQVRTVGNEHSVTLPWLGKRSRWHVTINGRDADAPTMAAQFMIAAKREGPAAQMLWSAGANAAMAVSTTIIAGDSAVATAGRGLKLRLDARQFGATAPVVDISGHA